MKKTIDILKEKGIDLNRLVAAKVDGVLIDLTREIEEGKNIEPIYFDSEEGKEVFWHSSAHILAIAVKRVFPEVKLAIGPAIEEGFYYDFGFDRAFTEEDIEKIEKEVYKVLEENIPFERIEMSKEEAIKFYKERGEKYKVEILEEIEDDIVSFYKNGDFIDLCRGPHLPSTGYVKAFKILSFSGAYWRGDEKNEMLQRIYGISFPTKEELDEFLYYREEAKKRDHRKLGQQLGLFSFHPEAPGEAFWHHKGVILRNLLIEFMRDIHDENDYIEVSTPLILKRVLWERSGHWENYKENMFTTEIEDEDYAIKPMNCPGGMLMYKERKHSYKEFPLRVAEFGLVHRYERSGVLNGLFRVRAFTQDDAHIFLMPEQIKDEIKNIIKIVQKVYDVFGFEYMVELSTRPEKYIGSLELWNYSEDSLKKALDEMGIDYKINEGDGAFYGPKIDFHLRDSMKRTHQCATIQLDMNLPERFDLTYIGPDGKEHRPVVIHRAIYGSIERFIGILIEHYGGDFPLWLAPEQVRVVPVSDKFLDYAIDVYHELRKEKIRVDIDTRNERVGYKIRQAELEKVPYVLVLGKKEEEAKKVSVRKRKEGDLGQIEIEEFILNIKKEIEEKA